MQSHKTICKGCKLKSIENKFVPKYRKKSYENISFQSKKLSALKFYNLLKVKAASPLVQLISLTEVI